MVDDPYANNAGWRDEIPPGWLALYDQLIRELLALDSHLNIAQAKEKFGELRVYLDSYEEGAHELIDAASRESRRTCQNCGSPAVLRATLHGYYATVCDEHAGKMQVVHRDPIAARFRLGADGLKEIRRAPLDLVEHQGMSLWAIKSAQSLRSLGPMSPVFSRSLPTAKVQVDI